MSSSRTIAENRKLFAGTDHAASYRLYRPTYPPQVLGAILNFLAAGKASSTAPGTPYKMAAAYRMAVDMACGTGQATPPLAPHFAKVIGCDVSASQIEEAQKHNTTKNVEYRVAPAEDMPFVADGSVDLVTCALAFHWVEPEVTYREVKRILRKGGVLAIYAYGMPSLGTQEARDLFDEFWLGTLKEFASPQINILSNHYRDVNPPLDDLTRNDEHSVEIDVPLSSFIGYLSSYSPYRTLMDSHPGSDVLEVFSDRLKSVLAPGSTSSDDPTIHVSYPVFIVMGRRN